MKYKIDEEVVFHRVGHRYDGCVCTIDSIDEDANLYILNVGDVKIVAEEYNLSEVPVPFEIGDIVSTANGTVLLYCRVIRDNKIVGNVVDTRGIVHNIRLYHITKADKDNTKKFFEQLKNNNPVSFKHLTDKVLREYNHHIKKILQILDYEID